MDDMSKLDSHLNTEIKTKITIVRLSIWRCEVALRDETHASQIKRVKYMLRTEEKNLQELQDQHPEYFI
jgi:hypothetical protein